MLFSRYLENEKETLQVARSLAQALEGRGVVFLQGHLGAGKTTFCRGVLESYGHTGAVKSPTYTLVEPYTLDNLNVYHFDLYRLSDPEELEYMGIRDYFDEGNLCLVEWPEQGEGILPQPDLYVRLQADEGGRSMTIESLSEYGRTTLNKFDRIVHRSVEG